jgi:hypothetical protein
MIMPPGGNGVATAEDTHEVPLLVKTLPDVLGATVATAEVPLPTNTALAVKVDVPVPPFATGVTPAVDIAEAKIKSDPFHATVTDVPLATETPAVGPTPRTTTAKPPEVLFTTT